MSNSINIILLSLGAVQGWLLGLFLIRRKPSLPGSIYFIAILITISLQLTFKVVSKAWLMHNFHFPYILSYTLPFLIGPLLYLQVKANLINVNYRKDLLHFVPFLFFAFTNGISHLYDFGIWGWYLGISPWSRLAFEVISLGVYFTLSWRLMQTRTETWIKLRGYVIIVATAELIIIVALAVMYAFYLQIPDARLFFVVLTLVIYWLTYQHLTKPDMSREKDHLAPPQMGYSKYGHSGLKEEDAARAYARLQSLLQGDKIYLQSDVTIDWIASQVGVSRHHLSQIINERFQKSYFELLNEFRLKEVMERLRNPRYQHHTIAAIAMDSGFNAVSTFNELFKKTVGVTPSRYREQEMGKITS